VRLYLKEIVELAANGVGSQESIGWVRVANEPQLDTGWSTADDNLNESTHVQ